MRLAASGFLSFYSGGGGKLCLGLEHVWEEENIWARNGCRMGKGRGEGKV